ncbi:hypothetical protein PR202_ga31489 [Eleusine coracana subsp. coracana]|uniref:CCAAT-binding factor domain-containing protein n=1 Tax=Eleusine coracana subsp. coracana TaxID=191504 RepID=A0AAV5DSC8_ELECO|nr:hypothetical protein PR202_ga31489 [Eleusine coracana subsp. coracana]
MLCPGRRPREASLRLNHRRALALLLLHAGHVLLLLLACLLAVRVLLLASLMPVRVAAACLAMDEVGMERIACKRPAAVAWWTCRVARAADGGKDWHSKRVMARGLCDRQDKSPRVDSLSVSERLQCCIVAFKVWRSNLEALNVDLQDFFVQLYNLILEYRPDRDCGDVLADALKTLLWEGKQQDMLRAAAFIKRLATFALSFGSAEAIAGFFF